MKSRILLLVILFTASNHFSNDLKKNIKLNDTFLIQKSNKIYLLGGIISAITQKEIDFAKKYNIVFHDFGCVPPTNLAFYESENQNVFNLLNLKFGIKWQNEINENTLGFKKWKEKNN